jgi:AMP nucleosidase
MDQRLEIKKSDYPTKKKLEAVIEKACDLMEEIYDNGEYPKLTVKREWSNHNPIITGEIAVPKAYRWYLSREIYKLVDKGSEIKIFPSRPVVNLNEPSLFDNLDEDDWDITQKKMFLFSPERIDISLNRLEHYTGTMPEHFQRNILFTNYDMHVEVFQNLYPGCIKPSRKVQMPAYHHKLPDNKGFTLINIGVGPSNAKTITDHVAVLRPDTMIMVGHCGGLRNHQEIGDFVLASGFMRADGVLDEILPLSIPIIPNHLLNIYLIEALKKNKLNYRLGTVYTTANRNWEFIKKRTVEQIHMSRSVAIDMESATVATNGYRYRIPFATLLCVSDKPLHGKPKLSGVAQTFYDNSKEMHLKIVIEALEMSRKHYSEGLPNSSIRAINEPLMGGTE